jgi:hypothetical protein
MKNWNVRDEKIKSVALRKLYNGMSTSPHNYLPMGLNMHRGRCEGVRESEKNSDFLTGYSREGPRSTPEAKESGGSPIQQEQSKYRNNNGPTWD